MKIKSGLWEFHRTNKTEASDLAETYRDVGRYTKVFLTPDGKGYTIIVSDFPIPKMA